MAVVKVGKLPSQAHGSLFEVELGSLLNRHSAENNSNTPDYALATYLTSCLMAFNTAVQERDAFDRRRSMESSP